MFSTITWLLGIGGGAIAGLLALYLVPSAKPIVDWFGENIPKALNVLKEGISDIVDNGATILTVLALVLGSYMYGNYNGKVTGAEQIVKELRKDYTFVPRKRR